MIAAATWGSQRITSTDSVAFGRLPSNRHGFFMAPYGARLPGGARVVEAATRRTAQHSLVYER